MRENYSTISFLFFFNFHPQNIVTSKNAFLPLSYITFFCALLYYFINYLINSYRCVNRDRGRVGHAKDTYKRGA